MKSARYEFFGGRHRVIVPLGGVEHSLTAAEAARLAEDIKEAVHELARAATSDLARPGRGG